ncbi:copper amine oxidase N-terminal domain-containing protein [Paenibacillus psychroresistens]|uniref:Copper amine oxidase N-terminal domain-containing protein n=1 Tax=Paenibacillus psychroresistens TaxID=1778678 RepID=A0A6B8RLM5_9BACL|nr:copper amine oxidase N-terminal domain-containing protein [Paenibacillus psychroresistens]QGQ96326.1 copper amine oxidase N-terminal domain-containing protein [Paenibacillus psychroresistens]
MKKRAWKKLISFSLVIALVVLVGCQALGSLDLSKSIVDAMLANSQMSKQSLTLDLITDDSKTSKSDEESAVLKLFSHLKLNLDQVKQESLEKISVRGSLEVLNRTIPFEAFVSPTLLVLKLEGAKKPLVLDLAGKAIDSADLLSLGIEKDIIEQFTSKITKDVNLHKAALNFLVNGLPNPEGITLDNVTETVYGESLSLNHVQAKIDGSQIIPLVKKFVLNLLQDDKGLREFVSQFYDVVQPVLIAVFDDMDKKEAEAKAKAEADAIADSEATSSDNPDLEDPEANYEDPEANYEDSLGYDSFLSPILKGLESVLKDRAMGIELIHTEVKQLLVLAMVGLQTVDEIKDPLVKDVFSDKSYVKADLYIDNSGKLRKTKTELNFTPPAEENEGIESVKLTMESEHWNINEPVIADVIDTTDSFTMDSITKPAEMLAILDKDSALYLLLKDDLQITKKSIVLNMSYSEYEPYSMLPYIDNNVTMVPARFISEQLDADVTFDPATQQVTVNDAASGNKIILTLQSKKAIWNGDTFNLEGAVRNRDGTTYVPLKFIAKALGAEVKWEDVTKTITITRD